MITKRPELKIGLGYLPSPRDTRDFQVSHYLPPTVVLPPRLSYRPKMTPVKYQGQLGSCVAFGAGAINEYLHDGPDLSELWLYDQCKRNDGIPEIPGTYPRVALEILQRRGMCREVYWRYVDSYPPATTPAPGADVDAFRYRVGTYAYVDLAHMRETLITHGPLGLGYIVYENYIEAHQTGIWPAPAGKQKGGHFVCVTGYDDDRERFEIKNSWSWALGDGGYYYLPYSIMPSIFLECWSVIDDQALIPRWPDLADYSMTYDDLLAQDRVWQTGIMLGFDDGLFHPTRNITRHQVGTVMVRLGLLSSNPWNSKADYEEPATRGWIHQRLPALQFKEERWGENLTRFQLLLLVGRCLVAGLSTIRQGIKGV